MSEATLRAECDMLEALLAKSVAENGRLQARVKELEAELDNRHAIERMNQVNPQGDTL